MFEYIVSKFNYWIYIFLMMLGLWAMIGKRNFVKKLIGMNIFQVSIILFYISIGSKTGGTIPILTAHDAHAVANPLNYMNPLPHVLMLTAIVVGIATTGVALAIIIKVYNQHKSLNEDEILENLRKSGV